MKSPLVGIGEPVVFREWQDGIPIDLTMDIFSAMGFGSWREWINVTNVLKDPVTPDWDNIAFYKKAFKRAVDLGIEITAFSGAWFLPEGCIDKAGCAVPPRDLGPGSLYRQTLDMLETSFATATAIFPEVAYWEFGNEWNLDHFLYVDGYYKNGMTQKLTLDEKADIAVDLMYHAAKGIRRGNPNAKVVMMPSSPCTYDIPYWLSRKFGIAYFMDKIYSRIASGNCWSSNTDDYFDVAAWHPYEFDYEPGSFWIEMNKAARRVMEKYGDGHKHVMLTELGYTDYGDPEKEKVHAVWFKKMFDIIKNELPYIRAVHIFRLYEDDKANAERKTVDWGGIDEVYYGLFREPHNGLTPRTKAYAVQELAGGTGDLTQFGYSSTV